VRVTEAKDFGSLSLKMSGVKLTNVEGFLKKSDPFYQFTRKDMGQRGSEWNVVHKSEKVKNNLNPNWQEESVDVFMLCGGDLNLPLVLEVLDYESDGNHVLMGSVETSVNGLIATKESGGFELSKEGESTGQLIVETAEVIGMKSEEESVEEVVEDENMPASFMDYINGGCEISLSVAIDFTGSNGDPREPGTLHYMNPEGGRNDYEKAISAVGGVLAGYDSDKKFPVWGFGAKYSGQVYHCFQCGPDAEADGITGVLNAYRKTFESGLVMSSPTDITEVLSSAAAFARSGQEHAASEGKQKYSVLLILTDGSVSDIGSTIETLNLIADSPLSVVIVGIGNADFGEMQFLDESGSGLDVCQFVEFNAHSDDFSSLTRATLAEIPNQLTNYYSRHGIQPNPPLEVVEEDIVVEPFVKDDIDLDFKFQNDGKIEATPQESTLWPLFFAGAVGVGIGVALNYAFEQHGSEEVVVVERYQNYWSGDISLEEIEVDNENNCGDDDDEEDKGEDEEEEEEDAVEEVEEEEVEEESGDVPVEESEGDNEKNCEEEEEEEEEDVVEDAEEEEVEEESGDVPVEESEGDNESNCEDEEEEEDNGEEEEEEEEGDIVEEAVEEEVEEEEEE